MKTACYQGVGDKTAKREDHVWLYISDRRVWKCVLCGGITHTRPPNAPTPEDWNVEAYERLTERERAMSPRTGESL